MYTKRGVSLISKIVLASVILSIFTGCQGRVGGGNSPVDLYIDAIVLREQRQTDQAISKLDKAIKKNEAFSQAHSLKGDIYQQQRDYENASIAYERATLLNEFSFHDFFNLGKVYQVMQRFADAVRSYTHACELQPEHFEAHYNTAQCYTELEQYDDALIYGRRAEQIDPNVTALQRLMGEIYQSKNDHEQAVTYYKRALEIDSKNPDIMVSLAVAYLKTKRDEPAKELLNSAIVINRNFGKAYNHLGYCYLLFYEKAARAYKEALDNGDVNSENLEALRQQGDDMVASAIENYSRAISIDDQDWEAQRGLGVAYIIQSKLDAGMADDSLKEKAISHWRASLQINPDQSRADELRNLIAKYRAQ